MADNEVVQRITSLFDDSLLEAFLGPAQLKIRRDILRGLTGQTARAVNPIIDAPAGIPVLIGTPLPISASCSETVLSCTAFSVISSKPALNTGVAKQFAIGMEVISGLKARVATLENRQQYPYSAVESLSAYEVYDNEVVGSALECNQPWSDYNGNAIPLEDENLFEYPIGNGMARLCLPNHKYSEDAKPEDPGHSEDKSGEPAVMKCVRGECIVLGVESCGESEASQPPAGSKDAALPDDQCDQDVLIMMSIERKYHRKWFPPRELVESGLAGEAPKSTKIPCSDS